MGVLSVRVDTTAVASLTATQSVLVLPTVPTASAFHPETGPATTLVALSALQTYFGTQGQTYSASVTTTTPSASVVPLDASVALNDPGATIDGGAHSFYPVRGTVSVTATTTFKEGYAFGVKAAATIAGVIDQTSATRVGALFAKVDSSAATITAGQVSAAWFDWGATATTPTSAECNVIRVQNTTAAVINSLIYGYGKATYFADLSDNGAGWFVATAPTSLAKSLKVHVNGTTYYIPLYSAAS